MTAEIGAAMFGAVAIGVLALNGAFVARDSTLPPIFSRALFGVAVLFLVPPLVRLWVFLVAG